MSKRTSLSDQLRHAVLNCGKSQYRVAKDIGTDRTALFRFLTGERGISVRVLDKLGDYLHLEIVSEKKGKGK